MIIIFNGVVNSNINISPVALFNKFDAYDEIALGTPENSVMIAGDIAQMS